MRHDLGANPISTVYCFRNNGGFWYGIRYSMEGVVMLLKAALGSALFLFAGSCFAATANELAEDQVRAIGRFLPMQYGEGVRVIGVRSQGSKVISDYEISATKRNLSKNDLAIYLKTIRESHCNDPTSRNYMTLGLSYEVKLIWRDGATSLVNIDSKSCDIKKGEVNAETEASVKQIVDSTSLILPVKIDEFTTWVSISQYKKLGIKYTYIVDISRLKISTSQLKKNLKRYLINSACKDPNLYVMVRGGVQLIYHFQEKSGRPFTEAIITHATCNG